ncbi:MAG: Xaa-Pro aminopeptidase [Planctomycetota bacterium]
MVDTLDDFSLMHHALRQRFLNVLAREEACALIPSGSAPTRNSDCEYLFRPEGDFFYLTGFREPDCVLLLVPQNEEVKSVLFLRDRDPKSEVWTGRRLGVERAPGELQVDAAYDIDEMWSVLPDLLKGNNRMVYRLGRDEERDREMISLVGDMRDRARRGAIAPTQWIDPSVWLHELRLIKTNAELGCMRRAAEITAEAHIAAMATATAGESEMEVDALLNYTFRKNGSSGSAYNNIVAGGDNACILHYVENDAELVDGELLLIDAGCEWEFYASDVTRTFPVSGTFSKEQRALYAVVLDAQKAVIESVKPGLCFDELHNLGKLSLVRGLLGLGLLEGTPEEALESEEFGRFYMHGTSHWLGLDVHDCGSYWGTDESRRLEPGMVLTVEPGIYLAADEGAVEERWRGIGIRIEDDVLVTPTGHEVLTSAIPKEIDEVEAACQATTTLVLD